MKNTIVLTFILLLIMAGSSTCKKNNSSGSYTPSCTGVTSTFAANVSPLILSSCAKSDCHAAGSSSGPGALTTYAQIKNAASTIRSSVVSGSMPQNSSLTSAQRNIIVCWIDAGATNN